MTTAQEELDLGQTLKAWDTAQVVGLQDSEGVREVQTDEAVHACLV